MGVFFFNQKRVFFVHAWFFHLDFTADFGFFVNPLKRYKRLWQKWGTFFFISNLG
jgi:hypothetical protein